MSRPGDLKWGEIHGITYKCLKCGTPFLPRKKTAWLCSKDCSLAVSVMKSTIVRAVKVALFGRAKDKQYRWGDRNNVRRSCVTCDCHFSPWSATSVACSFHCAGVYSCIVGHDKRVAKLRGRGRRVGYPSINGVHAHRAVAEKMLGRKLLPEEVVHHKNRNKWDYSEDNLQVLASSAEHMNLHREEITRARWGLRKVA